MTKQQAHEIKLQASLYAEACAMLAYAKRQSTIDTDLAIAKCAEERNRLFEMINNVMEG